MAHSYKGTYFLLVITLIIAGGCSIKEDLSDCNYLNLKFKVEITQDSENQAPEIIDTAYVYVFNSNVYVRSVDIGDTLNYYTLGLENKNEVSVTAWGNLKSDSIVRPQMYKGIRKEDAILKLIKSDNFCKEPPDLFFGGYNLGDTTDNQFVSKRSSESNEDTISISLKRFVSAVTITGKHVAERFGTDTSGCYFIIKGSKDAVNFNGEICGSEAVYSPTSYFDTEKNLKTKVFKILPLKNNEYLTIELYRREEKLFSINSDSNGELLCSYMGKQLNIMIDFYQSTFNIRMVITPWGETWQDTEM